MKSTIARRLRLNLVFIDYFVTDYRSLEMLNAFKKMAAYCHVKSRGHRIIGLVIHSLAVAAVDG